MREQNIFYQRDSVKMQYFGNQRKLGMRNENPDINQFGYNANTLRIQCNVSCPSGNTRGRYNSKHSWEEISDDIVPKGKW